MSQAVSKLTLEQAAAIHTPGTSIGLSAGAGCGKTFVLTRRFLEHLRPGGRDDPLSGVVAITFTDRAAREMRDRIRTACHAELQQCPEEEVDHWLRIVRQLDSARIGTIHSFCSGLLRSNAVTAGIDPGFALLEETIGDAFLRRVVADQVRTLLSQQNEDCMLLVLNFGLERTIEHLVRLTLQRFQAEETSFHELTTDQLAAKWMDAWHTEFVPGALRDFATSPTSQRVLRLLREHRPEHPEMLNRRAILLDQLAATTLPADISKFLATVRDAAKVQGGGTAKHWPDAGVFERVKTAFSDLRGEVDKLDAILTPDDSVSNAAAALSIATARVARLVADAYEARKSEAGLLDFDDLLLRARNLLRDSEEVRKRVSAGIDLLMVDEFQDTDPVQADVVRHLCGAQLKRGKLFLVGDAQQSIYRFRRADPHVFSQLRGELPERGRLPLSTNFRSQPAILNFVNAVFSEALGDSFQKLTPHLKDQVSPTPCVEFLFAAPHDGYEGDKADECRRREAVWLARRIAAFLQDPTPRIRDENSPPGEIRLRRARPGDIAILFRTLSNVPIYEEELRKAGVDYYLVGGRAFFAQQEVFDLVNLCRYLDNADDEISLVGVLRSPFFSLSDDALFAVRQSASSLSEGLLQTPPAHLPETQQEQVQAAARLLTRLRSIKDRVPLAELLNEAIRETGYDAALLNEFLGRRKLANLRKLIAMARQFDHSGSFTLPDFVRELRESIAHESHEELAATQPETSHVVRLMTVHQSKGLEFPIVCVADMGWARGGGGDKTYYHSQFGPLIALPKKQGESLPHPALTMHRRIVEREEDAESLRLFYVAATRAADYLILSAGLPASRKLQSNWLQLLSERFDLQTGLPAGDPYLGRTALGNIAPEEIPDIRVHHVLPEVEENKNKSSESVRLSLFRSLVENAEPAELPASVLPLVPDFKHRTRFTVSELERVDADRRGTKYVPALAEAEDIERSHDWSNESAASDFGTLMHRVLQRLDFTDPNSAEVLLQELLIPFAPVDRQSHLANGQKHLSALLASDVARELQSANKVLREIDFLLRWPVKGQVSNIVAGQIDVLSRTAGGNWRILDYKTGAAAHHDESTVREIYEFQMGIYALATQQMFGEPPERVELVLIGDEIRRVSISVTDTLLADIGSRLALAIDEIRTPSATRLD